jgi:hypothetical protein
MSTHKLLPKTYYNIIVESYGIHLININISYQYSIITKTNRRWTPHLNCDSFQIRPMTLF